MNRDVYAGEAQFLAWGDGPAGPWVKLLLPDSDDLAPFRGMTAAKKTMAGQLLALKIVEVDPDAPQVEEPTEAAHRTLGPLALLAVRWCRDPKFQAWAGNNWPHNKPVGDVLTEEQCRALILDTCKIGSRRELDLHPMAAKTFHEEFRAPFMASTSNPSEAWSDP